MTEEAFQDFYPDDLSQCYGCGKLNTRGHQLKSRWEGEESVACFTPHPYHTAIPGYVYGGLLESLIGCLGTGTVAAARLNVRVIATTLFKKSAAGWRLTAPLNRSR